MKSWHYIVIFLVVVVVIGGAVLMNARTVGDITDETVTIKQTQTESVDEQKDINVLADADFESDLFDAELEEDLSDLDDLDELFVESTVTF